jgi:hypothetical protein
MIEEAYTGVDVGDFIFECKGVELFDFLVFDGFEAVGVSDEIVSFWGRAGKSVYSSKKLTVLSDVVKVDDDLFACSASKEVKCDVVRDEDAVVDISKMRKAGFSRYAKSSKFTAIVLYSDFSRIIVSSYK